MTTDQLSLLDYAARVQPINFKGQTYDIPLDYKRLNAQQARVWKAMEDGEWRSLREISNITNDPEASVSARLRSFNADELSRYFRMESKRKPGTERRGLWLYRVTLKVS